MPTARARQRPRAMVIHELWRGLRGVEALSGPQGGPLSRTVKLILDPLVIRPVRHPECAGPLVTAEGAAKLAELIGGSAVALRDTAAWFTLFKQIRRAERITDGHPQDRYFQRCFELAVTAGAPRGADGHAAVEEALREIHRPDGPTTAALKEYLADPGHAAELAALLAGAWRARRAGAKPADGAGARVTAVLDACPSGNGGAELAALIAADAGTAAGRALWDTAPALGAGERPARELGLTAHDAPPAPALGTPAPASAEPPFDRTVYQRLHTALRTTADRSALPGVPALVAAEIARATSPWALSEESLRVAATIGARLALGLSPSGEDRGGTAAERAVNGRWRREAYVLRARRLAADGEGEGPLAEIARELRRPWRPYARRLWARLHGRDVRGTPIGGAAELWDLLDGVARSVILDQRDRVRGALSIHIGRPVAAESGAA